MAIDPKRHQGGRVPPASVTPQPRASGSATGWVIVSVIGALILIANIGRCSPTPPPASINTAATETNGAQQALTAAIAAQAPPPVEKLNPSSIRRGEHDLTLASGEGLAGEMIFSQNCYDALSRTFSWKKLDVCGAFDADAVATLGDSDTTGFDKEAAWFQSETAAGRYLKAAAAAGQDADGADERLSGLQARIALHHPAPADSNDAASAPALNDAAPI